jgi:hypothetical protein
MSVSIRADAEMTREAALAALSGRNKIVFEEYLAGDEAARSTVKKSDLSSPLHSAYLHAKADIVEIGEFIKTLNDPQLFAGAASGGMSLPIGNSGMSVAVTGGPFTQVAPGVVMVGGPSGPPLSPELEALVQRVADPDLLVQDQNIRNEISHRIDAWEALYGSLRGSLQQEVTRKVIQSESGNGLTVLLERALLTPTSQRQVRYRDAEKKYAKDAYDTQTVFFADTLLKSTSIPLLRSLLTSPVAPGFIAQAKDESVYSAQDYLFDRREAELLDAFMAGGARPNLASKEFGKRAWAMEIINKMDANDMPVFERLVNVYGMKLDVFDEMRVTPFSRAVILGNLPLVKFLKDQPSCNFYLIDTMNSTALDYAHNAPLRRAEKQASHMESYLFNMQCFQEELEEWKENVDEIIAAAETAAKLADEASTEPPKPPDLPEPPTPPALTETPPDYPLEIIGIVEQVFSSYQPVAKVGIVADENMGALSALGNLNTY